MAETMTAPVDLQAEAGATAAAIDNLFSKLLAKPGDARDPLYDAMCHAAIDGGKRMRPLLVKAASRLFNVPIERALRVGAAIEAIHVYSLIHDDLPCMDDDDLRRGKPTLHKAYDEAIAVLAGDSLHDLAFALLAHEATHPEAQVRVDLIAELAKAAGPDGMAGGQVMDLEAEKVGQLDLDDITRLQQLKTGALIEYAVEAACILGQVGEGLRTPYRGYARNIGLAFQIADDLLDVGGDEEKAGKRLGKDADAGKATFVSLMGEHRAREQAAMLVEQANEHLAHHGEEADLLRAIARFAVERDR
ncbi:polyprenyl synthetase family protein [Sphingomicrobium sp. XHP0235]|uniref:polyprenyl synthetase family protein n=1 Tax=Sphingomicrobium aquimarinum TaxID=3133971 RepID=UPI0031FE7618